MRSMSTREAAIDSAARRTSWPKLLLSMQRRLRLGVELPNVFSLEEFGERNWHSGEEQGLAAVE